MRYEELTIEGRNAVLEAFRSGKTIDKLFVLDGCQDGPVRTILREAKKHDTIVQFVKKERLDQLSQTGHHQGVIASAAAYEYAEISDILQNAKDKGEAPFIIFLDNIEDPHNLGAIIRTANLAGAHGVVIPKRRAVGLTATVARVSAGALNYTPVAKVTNIGKTIEELAEALGVDAAGLKASFDQYNADAEAGAENAVLGEVPSRALDAEGPYYGVRVEPANHMTKGGVVANEKAQVLYEDGTVVKGLYASGEVTWQSGGYSQSVVFGKVAGEHAAAELK